MPACIKMKRGSEGPYYDPYSYSDVTIHCNSMEIVIRQGLGTWIKVDGKRLDLDTCSLLREAIPDHVKRWDYLIGKTVRDLTGYPFSKWISWYDRLNSEYEPDPMGCLADYE